MAALLRRCEEGALSMSSRSLHGSHSVGGFLLHTQCGPVLVLPSCGPFCGRPELLASVLRAAALQEVRGFSIPGT